MKKKNTETKKKILSDCKKANIFRWWIAGAVYYLVGFGTQLGLAGNPIDLIFFLGVGMLIATKFIYNPIAYNMFSDPRLDKLYSKKHNERTVVENVSFWLVEFMKCQVCVILVYCTYQIINNIVITLFSMSEDSVVLFGGPIIFGLLFLFFYDTISSLSEKIRVAKKGENNG